MRELMDRSGHELLQLLPVQWVQGTLLVCLSWLLRRRVVSVRGDFAQRPQFFPSFSNTLALRTR